MKVALQLYSIRDKMEENFLGSLERVKEAGYDGVEFAGYGGIPAKEMKDKLEQLGLAVAGSHVSYDDLKKDLEKEVSYAKEIGAYSVVCPYFHADNKAGWMAFFEDLNAFGKRFAQEGILFGYHNHAQEFEKLDGTYIMDLLLEHCDPNYVTAEFDVHWVYKGGESPLEYVTRYADRCLLLHAKEVAKDGKSDTEVGNGIIPFPEMVKSLPNLEWLIVEQEGFSIDEWESIRKSCDYLKSI